MECDMKIGMGTVECGLCVMIVGKWNDTMSEICSEMQLKLQ